MSRARILFHVELMLSLSFLLAVPALAQYRTSIQGVVTDPTGAVVSGANLTLTNPATNEKQVRVSDEAGVFNFNALPAAVTFRLEVEGKGFQKKVFDNLALIPEQPNALNVELTIGSESQTVNVSGDSLPAVDTETASLQGNITNNQIQHMPSFGRDVFQLLQLAPGVFGDGAQGNGGGGVNLPGTQGPGGTGGNAGIFQTENGPQALAHGQQYENNSYSIDGISTTSAVWGGTTVITPSEDSVQDVKIVSNSYDAESGRFAGAQVQVTSKGGGNDIHGSLFFTTHQPNLNAFQRFNGNGNGVLRDNLLWHQFGGSVGGPIWKNKIFAFFNYETVRTPNGGISTSTGWYDTPGFDALASSGGPIANKYLTFPGHGVNSQSISATATCLTAGLQEGVNCITIPGQGLNIGRPLTTGVGKQDLGWQNPTTPGTGGDGGGGANNLDPTTADIANYTTFSSSTSSKVQYNGRLDADVTAKDRISFSIYWVPQSATFLNGPARAYNLFHHNQVNDAFSLIWIRTFSSTFLNEARVNAAGWRWNEITSNPQSPVGLPSDRVDDIGSIKNLQSFGPNVGSILNQWTYTYKDVATKIIGRHTIKFGGEVTRLFYLNNCAGCGVPNYNFYNMWDFLNDAPHTEGSGFNPMTGFPSTLRQDDRENFWGFFAQDDLKLRRNLTVNLGLRYSYFGPLYSKQDNMFVAHPGARANYLTGLTVSKGDSWNPQKNNLGPQIGFAWSPTKFNDRLVVRGGYGLSYNQEEIAISGNIQLNPGLITFPFFGSASPQAINPNILYGVSSGIHNLYGYPENPNTITSFGANGLPTSGATVGIGIFPHNLPTMRTHHYSFDTQYDIGHQWIMTLGYQGSLSRDTYFHSNPNAIPAASGYALNPQIGFGDYWGVNGRGNYNALLSEIKHQFSHQFMADAQFTWAKSMDTSSAPYSEQIYAYNSNFNYGRSDYDVAKSFKLYGMWQPVLFRGSNGWLEKIAGGWSISGIWNWHSGFPWNPLINVLGPGNPPSTPKFINGSLYCDTCGYGQILPAAYLGGAGNSTSNDQFKTGSNYPNKPVKDPVTGAFISPYYSNPAAALTGYTGQNGTPAYGNNNPPAPGVARNSLTGPGYRNVDLTLSKGFGLPKMPVLGEAAKFELRMDVFNVFNNLNFNPTSISNNIANSNFGTAQSALAARVVMLQARFSF